ncbi:MAG: type II toxin-antitoxin system VapC family toxin, partial [Bdellovibrionota bacterium]
SQYRDRNMDALHGFSAPFDCLHFCHESAKIFGQLRAELEKKGTMIGVFDLQIASIAIANDMTLVTNNEKEYSRLSGLKIENWTNED